MNDSAALAERLNEGCHCVSVDRVALRQALAERLPAGVVSHDPQAILPGRDALFSDSPVFLGSFWRDRINQTIEAIATLVAHPDYQRLALNRAPHSARFDPGTSGGLLGFDFHLAEDGPQLIEVNTNPGGALLGVLQADAQAACCSEVAAATTERHGLAEREHQLARALLGEAKPGQTVKTVAIVDTDPTSQFLYPEMLLYQRTFERLGLTARVVGPEETVFDNGRLHFRERELGRDKEPGRDRDLGTEPIDLVYNRLTDFGLVEPAQQPILDAYLNEAIALTPNPRDHALWADKRNLVVISDPELLARIGIPAAVTATLRQHVPRTIDVMTADPEELWSERKRWFMKPVAGFGSRGTYDGARITRKTFARVLEDGYVAQRKVPPGERVLHVDGEERRLKVDIRALAYRGELLWLSARLYRGQTTNMRTEGGGLATVFVVP